MSDEETYEMPQPFLHEIVNLYEEGSTQPAPAWVRTVSKGCIDVIGLTNRIETVAVRHKDDPGLNKQDDRYKYAWDFTDTGKLLRKVAATTAQLEDSPPALSDDAKKTK